MIGSSVVSGVARSIVTSITGRSDSAFSPLSLFADGDPGLWYDPHLSRRVALPDGWGTDYVGVSNSRFYYDLLPALLGQAPIYSDELLVNGDFSASTGWSLGTGWSISGGQAIQAGHASASNLSRSQSFTAGAYYELVIDCDSVTSGTLVPLVGSAGRAFNVTSRIGADGRLVAPGVQVFLARFGGTSSLFLQSQTNFVGSLNSASLKKVDGGGYHGIADGTGLAPAYVAGRLDFTDSRTLVASVPSMGASCTICYVNDSGVTYLDGQTISGTHSTPLGVSWYSYLLIGRALTASEKSSLTSYMLRRRRTILRHCIAVWGDSMAGGAGASSAETQWSTLLQYLFSPTRDRINSSTGGHTSAQVRAAVEADTIYRESVNILFDKRNYEETVADWLSNTAASIAHFSGHYIVMSCTTGSGEGFGTDYYSEAMEINASLASNYPNNYLDIRSYLISDGLTDAGITPTAQDLIDIAADTIPESLRSDTVHLNDAGQAVVAQKVYEFLANKGW